MYFNCKSLLYKWKRPSFFILDFPLQDKPIHLWPNVIMLLSEPGSGSHGERPIYFYDEVRETLEDAFNGLPLDVISSCVIFFSLHLYKKGKGG